MPCENYTDDIVLFHCDETGIRIPSEILCNAFL